jgi:hypothetical protein
MRRRHFRLRYSAPSTSLHVNTRYIQSWTSLKDTTKYAELGHHRAFLRYCKKRKWLKEDLSEDLTARELGIETSITKKFGMEPEEEKRVFAEILNFSSGSGYDTAQELHCFALVMRQTGLLHSPNASGASCSLAAGSNRDRCGA